jgi:hypothetical protein
VAALDRLEAARSAVAVASRDALPLALDALDRVFEELAGRPAVRGEGDSGGGRTVAYLDCRRDLDLMLGPAVLDELRMTLPAILEASRWWCGRVFARGADALARVAGGRDGPIGPLLGELDSDRVDRVAAAGDDLPGWARRHGLPRRVFARSPLERKPMLVDFASPALCRILRRWSATTAERAPDAQMELTEMLPNPDDCWLEDEAGLHTSELRLVAVDLTRL